MAQEVTRIKEKGVIMSKKLNSNIAKQAGFTLVELAIVLVSRK